MRGAICEFIDRTTPFQACCDAGQGTAAIDKAIERAPDLLILDLNSPTLDGVETASALRRTVPGIKTIGLVMFPAGQFSKTLITSAGFDVIVSKQEGLAKLAEAIKTLLPEALPHAGVEEALLPLFDIFKVADDGQLILVESSLTLDAANARIQDLGRVFPGIYIIHSQKTGHQTVVTVNKTDGIVQ